MNCRYTDRIRIVAATSSPGLRSVLSQFGDHIRRETLTVDLLVMDASEEMPVEGTTTGASRFDAAIAGDALTLYISNRR